MQKKFTKIHSNIVKGISILFLLFYHLFQNEYADIVFNVNYNPLPFDVFLMLSRFGNICVAVFIFLTTYGICINLFHQDDISPKTAFEQATGRFFRLMLNFLITYCSINLLWWYKFDYSTLYGGGKQGLLRQCFDSLGLAALFDTPMQNETWWYMEIAYLLIFLIPLLALCTKKVGYPIVFLLYVMTSVFTINGAVLRYLPTIAIAACAAYGKWLDKLLNLKLPLALQWIIGCAGILLCIPIRQYKVIYENYLAITDAFVVLVIIYFAGVLLSSIPVLKDILLFIGKHSLTIYLTHTFFYQILWREFIYSFHYAALIFLVLLGICLLYSVVLELLKKLLSKALQRLSSLLNRQ